MGDSNPMRGSMTDGDGEEPEKLPDDFFEIEVIANKPDPRIGDRELAREP